MVGKNNENHVKTDSTICNGYFVRRCVSLLLFQLQGKPTAFKALVRCRKSKEEEEELRSTNGENYQSGGVFGAKDVK